MRIEITSDISSIKGTREDVLRVILHQLAVAPILKDGLKGQVLLFGEQVCYRVSI